MGKRPEHAVELSYVCAHQQEPLMIVAHNAPTLISNRYHLRRMLGTGGMGVVHAAADRLTGQIVALKQVSQDVWDMADSHLGDAHTPPNITLQLAREFQTLASLRHPNIISVLDYGFDPDEHGRPQLYYTMELLENAKTILEAGNRLSLSGKLALLIQLLQAITYLHRRGVLHRDLKPENVLVDASGRLKVLDFGLALLRDAPGQDEGLSGTLAYMAPELLTGGRASEASDLYAVGVIAFQLLTGQHPFGSPDGGMNKLMRAAMKGEINLMPLTQMRLPIPPSADAPTLPEMMLRLLNPDAAQRGSSAYQIIRDLYRVESRELPAEDPAIRDSFLNAARFVGREPQFAQLKAALDKALDGSGSAWLIGGESGIGKSRLLDELRTHALTSGAQVLYGSAVEGGGLPFQVWRDPLRRLALSVALSDAEAGILKEIVPDIADLLDRPIPDAPDMEARDARQRLLRTIAGVLRKQRRPLVLLLEDLHWARESIDVLRAALPLTHDMPLLIIGSYRDDETPDLPARLPEMGVIKLERLSAAAVASLTASMLGESSKTEQIVGLLQSQTEGNAYFIVEIMRSLAEDAGSLAEIGSKTLPREVFAGGIEQVLRRRLRRVPDGARTLLQAAAVAGRVLDLDLLARLTDDDLEAWLLRCADAAVLDIFEGRWRFAHDKLRETLIADAHADGSYAALNERVAIAAEQLYTSDAERALRAVPLAEWWGAAGSQQKAREYLTLAGQQALDAADYGQAVSYFGRALALAEAQDAPPLTQAVILAGLSEAYYNQGKLEEVHVYAPRTLALLDFHPVAADRLRRSDPLWEGLRQLRSRLLPRRRSSPAPARYPIAMKVMESLIMVHYFQNHRAEMIYHMLFGLNIADANGKAAFRTERARFYGTASLLFALVAQRRIAHYYRRQADDLLSGSDAPNAEIWTLTISSIGLTAMGDFTQAIPRLRRCIELTRQIGHVRRYEEAAVTLCGAYYYSGRWQECRQLSDELLDSARASGNIQAEGWALDNHARFALRRGDFAEARRILDRCFDVYQQVKDTINTVWVHGAFAKSYLGEGDLDTAQLYVEQIAPILQSSITTSFGMTEPYSAVTEYYLLRWEQAKRSGGDVTAHRASALSMIRSLGLYGDIFRLAAIRRELYQGWAAHLDGETRHGAQILRRAIAHAEQIGVPYDENLARYEYARHLPGDHPQRRAQLEQAAHALDRLGALWDSQQAHRVLNP
jgi:serine/threonine protein kinase